MNNELTQRSPDKATAAHSAVCFGLAIVNLLVMTTANATPVSGNTQNSISGRVFIDTNVNGTNDASDHGLAGLPLVLYDIVNITCISTQTDNNGHYTFDNIQPSSYRIYEAANETVPTPENCNPEQAQDPAQYVSSTDNVSTMLTIDHEKATVITGVDFGDTALPTFVSDNNGIIFPGNVKHYQHTLTAPATGSVTFTSNVTAPSHWSSLLYHDIDCSRDLNGSETNTLLTSPLSTIAGSSICLINSVIAPDTAGVGQQSIVTLTADFTYSNGSSKVSNQTLQNTNTTTASHLTIAGSNKLTVTKTIRNLTQGTPETTTQRTANPGDTLEYRLTYRNIDSVPITMTELRMNDAVPPFTLLDANSVLCNNTPTTLKCVPDSANEPDLIWNFSGQLNADAQGTVTYRVIVE